jgi:hypothetical protein
MRKDADEILVDRLYELVDPDPWGVGFKMEMLDDSLFKSSEPYGWHSDWDARLHANRIRYLADSPELHVPIEVDNLCEGRNIYAMPVILDGHHRLFAHVWLGIKTIRASYGGRLDVLDYLKGKTDQLPDY